MYMERHKPAERVAARREHEDDALRRLRRVVGLALVLA